MVRSLVGVEFGLYQPFFGREGYAVLAAGAGLVLFVTYLASAWVARRGNTKLKLVHCIVAFCVWLPLAAVTSLGVQHLPLWISLCFVMLLLPSVFFYAHEKSRTGT